MNNEKYKGFLLDLGVLTSEYAKEAIQEYQESKGTPEEAYKTGYMMGFHRLITLMEQQGEVFDIPKNELGLSIKEEDFYV